MARTRRWTLNGAARWVTAGCAIAALLSTGGLWLTRLEARTNNLADHVATVEKTHDDWVSWVRQVDNRLARIEGYLAKEAKP